MLLGKLLLHKVEVLRDDLGVVEFVIVFTVLILKEVLLLDLRERVPLV